MVVLAVVVGVPAALCGAGAVWWARLPIDTVGEVGFTRPLAIPPLAQSRQEDGRRVFTLRAGAGTTDFGAGGATETWGFNGSYLGPTLRAARGEEVEVRVTNGLTEATTVHWHGHELPAAMDGGPHQPVAPGETWRPHWTIDQPAATTWYHPHPHGATAEHVYRGLAGMFILDDPESAALDLPSEYGVDDVPLIVQDKLFDGQGQLTRPNQMLSQVGVLGDTIVVNGTVGGYLDVTTSLVRLRLVNASNARVYDFGFHDDREFALIGTDGGLLPAPHRTGRVMLSPGERAEIVVPMRPGERAELRSYPPDLGTDPFNARLAGGDDQFSVVELRAADRLRGSPPLPDRLAAPPDVGADGVGADGVGTDDADVDPGPEVVTRRFDLGGTSINGRPMDLARIDEAVTAGATEVWEVTHRGGTIHNFHMHGVRFRVVEVAGAAPGPELSGWKDTVYVAADTTVRLAVRFPEHADPDLPYMYHCHVLKHEDQGMMGQFVVVAPGQEPGRPPGLDHTDH